MCFNEGCLVVTIDAPTRTTPPRRLSRRPSTPLPDRGAFFAERQHALLTVLGFERLDQRRQPLRLRFAGRQMSCSSYDLLDRAHRQRRTRENVLDPTVPGAVTVAARH